jgi:hypothetical protein
MIGWTLRSVLAPACCSSSSSLLGAAAGTAVASAALATSQHAAGQRSYHVARLASRGVISLAGPECVQFLQVSHCGNSNSDTGGQLFHACA